MFKISYELTVGMFFLFQPLKSCSHKRIIGKRKLWGSRECCGWSHVQLWVEFTQLLRTTHVEHAVSLNGREENRQCTREEESTRHLGEIAQVTVGGGGPDMGSRVRWTSGTTDQLGIMCHGELTTQAREQERSFYCDCKAPSVSDTVAIFTGLSF